MLFLQVGQVFNRWGFSKRNTRSRNAINCRDKALTETFYSGFTPWWMWYFWIRCTHWYKSFKNAHKLYSFDFTSFHRFSENLVKFIICLHFTMWPLSISRKKTHISIFRANLTPKMEIVYHRIYDQIFRICASVLYIVRVFWVLLFMDLRRHMWVIRSDSRWSK